MTTSNGGAATKVANGHGHGDSDGDLRTLKMQNQRVQVAARQALQLCVLAASLGSFCCGLFVGWSSPAMATLSAKYSAQHVARITSYLALGAAVGPLLVQRLWPRTGTKFAVIASCLMMCTSVIALFVDYGVACLLVARFASGLSVGCIQLLMPAYVQDIVECVDAAGRSAPGEVKTTTPSPTMPPADTDSTSPMMAFASAAFHLQFVLGVLTMFVTGLFDEHLPHLACVVMVVATVSFTIAACLLPESPRFLCQQSPPPQQPQQPARWWRTSTSAARSGLDPEPTYRGCEAARQILRPFLSSTVDVVQPVGLETDDSVVQVPSAIERLLQQWSAEADETPPNDRGVLALLRGGRHGTMGKRALFGTVTAVAAAQLMGVTSILFYMEKLLSLSYDATYTPATNAAVCALCLAAAAALPLFSRLPPLRRMLVPAAALYSCGCALFGLYCHYRGTSGGYAQLAPPRLADDDDAERPALPPVLLFGAVLAVYALGPMRLCMSGGCTVTDFALPSASAAPTDRQALALRSVLLAVGWLCVFGGVRVLPGLVNSIGVGWLLWYMAVNGALAAGFMRWWLRSGSRCEADNGQRAVALEAASGDVEKAEIVC